MPDITILHVAGDEAAAEALAARLPAHRCLQCCVSRDAVPPTRGALIAIWSAHAARQRAAEALDAHCLPHSGMVMICCVDNAPLPDLLDDADYWLIDLSIDDATVFEAERGRSIVEATLAARKTAAPRRDGAARRPSKAPLPFLGGAFAGFAGSVSLLGILGATAISAAQQWEPGAPPPADDVETAAGIPVWRSPPAPDREPWMDVQPAELQDIDVAQIRATLRAASARLEAGREIVDRRIARLDALARSEWPTSVELLEANAHAQFPTLERRERQPTAVAAAPAPAETAEGAAPAFAETDPANQVAAPELSEPPTSAALLEGAYREATSSGSAPDDSSAQWPRPDAETPVVSRRPSDGGYAVGPANQSERT